jgi:hypothetical protein
MKSISRQSVVHCRLATGTSSLLYISSHVHLMASTTVSASLTSIRYRPGSFKGLPIEEGLGALAVQIEARNTRRTLKAHDRLIALSS